MRCVTLQVVDGSTATLQLGFEGSSVFSAHPLGVLPWEPIMNPGAGASLVFPASQCVRRETNLKHADGFSARSPWFLAWNRVRNRFPPQLIGLYMPVPVPACRYASQPHGVVGERLVKPFGLWHWVPSNRRAVLGKIGW